MPPRPRSRISLAIQAINIASKKVRLTSELEDSLEQLDSIVKLLETSKLWPSALQRLSSLLRQRLFPLYKTFPILGIRFSVAVLATIYETKILPAAKSDEKATKASWEVVQAALLSGILDFLEAHSTSENRAIVATAFYPTLRLVFFPRSFPLPGTDLMYILYRLLSETVTSHPVNQAQLRDQEVLGSIQVGEIMSQTKSFLVIEALLELVVKLLPAKSNSDSIKARASFIRDVFDPAQFACSAAIAELFESPPTADWEGIFLKLIDLLASADAAFPQSFQISNFRIQGSKVYSIERLYVDDQGFVANIDEGDQIETFHANHTSVQSVKVAAPSKFKVSVTIVVFPPPLVGQTTITEASEGKADIFFDIDSKEVTRFLQSLRARGVKNIDQTVRKLSTAEETLMLDYDSTRKTVPVSTQDKVRDLAQLWDCSNSQSQSGQILSTSPLISHSVRVLTGDTPTQSSLPINEDPRHLITPTRASKPHAPPPYIFGTTNEELTDLSDVDEAKARSSRRSGRLPRDMRPRPKVDAHTDVESEDETLATRSIKKRSQKTVSSEDAMDDFRSPSAQSLRTTARGKDVPTGRRAARTAHLKSTSTSSTLALATDRKSITPNKTVNPATNNVDDFDQMPKPTARKRKASEASNPEFSDPETQPLPPKRLRNDPVVEMEVKATSNADPPRLLPRKRYGKKGRTSSPPPSSVFDVDFNELPAPSDAPVHKPKEEQKGRVSAMKDKGGRVALKKTKPGMTQSRDAKGIATLEASPTEPKKNANGPQRRSARVAGIPANNVLGVHQAPEPDNTQGVVSRARSTETQHHAQPDDEVKKARPPKKSQAAPWNDLDHIRSAATPTGATTGTVNVAVQAVPVVEEDVHEPLFLNDPLLSTDPVAEEAAEQNTIEDYFIPLKTGSESTSLEMSAVKDEIMIDLTQESPEPLPRVVAQLLPKSKSPVIRRTVKDAIDTSRQAPEASILGQSPVWTPPPPNPGHARVSFAPSASIHSYRVFDFSLENTRVPGSSYAHNYSHSKRREKQTSEKAGHSERKRYSDPMPRIIDTINEITQVVVQNTSRRFDKVGKDLRAGQRSILLETASDLEAILGESTQHHSNFVSLESEYAAHHGKIVNWLQEVFKTEKELSVLLARTIQEHNRSSLSSKFSNTLFSSPLPSIVSTPKLVL